MREAGTKKGRAGAIPHFCYGNTLVHPPLWRGKVTVRQIAQKVPYPVDVEAGKIYYWCACGQSRSNLSASAMIAALLNRLTRRHSGIC